MHVCGTVEVIDLVLWSCEALGSLQIDIASSPPNQPVSATVLNLV